MIRKLGYVAKLLCDEEEKLSAQFLRTIACEDVYSISLIQQCRSLEFHFGTNHVKSLPQNPDAALATLKASKNLLKAGSLPSHSLPLIHPSQLSPCLEVSPQAEIVFGMKHWNMESEAPD